jgi:polyphosphate kinase 2 (PPK2 family)
MRFRNSSTLKGAGRSWIVLQGIDTGGKDGTIRYVMSGVTPQGTIVTSFKAPTALEPGYECLWRIHPVCPSH